MKYLILVVVCLAWCTKVAPLPDNPTLTDISAGQNISRLELTNTSIVQSYLTTHSFDKSISGDVLDQQIIGLSADLLRYTQAQALSDATLRSVSMCEMVLNSWNTFVRQASSWLQYTIKQSTWRRKPVISWDRISLWTQPTYAITIKNTTPDLIEVPWCQPISPYGYARLYVYRNLTQPVISYSFKNITWSITAQFITSTSDDKLWWAIWLNNFQWNDRSFPLWSQIIVSWDIASISGTNTKKLASWILINTTQSWSYIISFFDTFGTPYEMRLNIYSKLILTDITSNIPPESQKLAYLIWIRNQYPNILLDDEKILKWNGTWVYTIEKNIVSENSSSSFALTMKMQSGEKLKTVIISDIFWVTGSLDVNFMMWPIKDSLKSTIIRWEWINLLTKSRNNRISIDYENVWPTPITYQSCERKPTVLTWLNRYGTPDMRLEDMLFDCRGTKIIQILTGSNTYRDPSSAYQSIPAQFSGTKLLRVYSPYDDPQYFAQSQIWIYVKQSLSASYVWLYDLATSKQITWAAMMTLYQYTSWWSAWSGVSISQWPYIISMTWRWDFAALTAQTSSGRWFVTLWWNTNSANIYSQDRSIKLQSSIAFGDVVDYNTIQRWTNATSRVYGYTDRWLYKPWDDIMIAWWTRKLTDIGQPITSVTWVAMIKIRLASDYNTIVAQLTWVLDTFWWFSTKFTTPTSLALGDYSIEFTDPYGSIYTQTIKINEYQKPTFFIDQKVERIKDMLTVVLDPTYYFGTKLTSWTYTIDRALSAINSARSDDTYYYDLNSQILGNDVPSSASFAWSWSTKPVSVDIVDRNTLPPRWLNSKIVSSIKDSLSNETQYVASYDDLVPRVNIGLDGQQYEWYYDTKFKPIKGVLSWTVDKLTYARYYRDRNNQSISQWLDGSMYYGGVNYVFVASWVLVWKNRTVPNAIKKPGWYLLLVQWYKKDWTWYIEVWHNEKNITFAQWDAYSYGGLNNNYTLKVAIDKKQYNENQSIPINITPYVKWATVLITVEQWNVLLDTFTQILDGSQINIPAKKSYFPSAMISVMQLVSWSTIQLSGKSIAVEPRMRQWYGQVLINRDIFALNIDIQTDKTQYKPWDTLTLTIKTSDITWKPVDSRLSVWIVDKSLNDLYGYFKSPLYDFFTLINTEFVNYTNMTWIYQSLKVYTKAWSKWWWWGSRNLLWWLRQKFEDVAFWRGGVYTSWWIYTTTITLPDNLTTWTIEAVWVTQDSKVWSKTKDFIATKDVILQPNLPLYLTVWDSIMMPIKVLSSITGAVQVSGSIKTIDNQIISTFATSVASNGSVNVPVTIDPKFYEYDSVIVEIYGVIDWKSDRSRQTIPLRTNGLQHISVKSQIWATGTISFSWSGISPKLNISLNTIPYVSISNAFEYMIHYPYGCTEQMLSTLHMLITARDSKLMGISGDIVSVPYSTPISITKAFVDTKSKVRANQKQDGGMSYRWSDSSSYLLSAYVYGMMVEYRWLRQWFDQQFDRLTTYLDQNWWAENPQEYLYYLYQKSKISKVDMSRIAQTSTWSQQNLVRILLTASITARQWDKKAAKILFDKVRLSDFDAWVGIYPMLTNVSLLKIYNDLALEFAPDKRDDIVVALLGQRNDQWLRWYSTLDNLSALQILSTYKQSWEPTCSMKVSWKAISWSVWSGSVTGDPTITRSCDKSIIADAQYTYGQLTVPPIRKNVEYLRWRYGTWNIWQTINAKWQFKVAQPARDVAVEFYIPSTIKFLDLISQKSYQPFEMQWWRWCQPDHYEVRFDRLFLYYRLLSPDVSCEVSIPWLVAYTWSAISVPSRIRQMYDDNVYARSY